MVIDRRYIVDENNNRTAVLLDIETFEEMEEAIESSALFARMRETDNDEIYDLDEARLIYERLRKEHNANKDNAHLP